ncbi:hypothetical protein [uncultured Rikenella sp.]|uniref:hypothetical protein n=1 Tax=uncultured Rikenella sp. TaxID=368003 RepID=UPI0025E7520A|nr:hypothetical protein [uncultured Rikenella sp.]
MPSEPDKRAVIAAPGYRGSDAGDPVYIGHYGLSWSATTGNIYALDLNFGVTYLDPSSSNGRACGLQLRCLSE